MLSLKFRHFFGKRHTTLSSSVSVAPPKVPQLLGKACSAFQKQKCLLYFRLWIWQEKDAYAPWGEVEALHPSRCIAVRREGSLRHTGSLPTLRFLSLRAERSRPRVKPKQSWTSHRGKVTLTRWELKFPLSVKPCCPHLPIRLEACCNAIFPWLARLPGFDTTVLQNQLFIKDVLHSAEIKEPEQMSLNIFPPCNDGK